MLPQLTLLSVTLTLFSWAIYAAHNRRGKSGGPRGLQLPGPKGLPLVGSVLQLSPNNPWLSFYKWAEHYGPIYQVNLGGQNHVWISDESIAHELLSKRGAIYSARPHIPALIDDNRDSGKYLPLMTNNDIWQRQRRFATCIMRNSSQAAYYGYPELEAVRLMKELLDRPAAYGTALESFIARITCRLAWAAPEASDELKQRARELLISVSPTGALGNKIPTVMSLPDKLSPAKAWERRRANTEKVFFEQMQSNVKSNILHDRAMPSWTKTFLTAKSTWNFQDDTEGAFAVGMHGIAGALTVAAPMQGFCLAMCLYPQYLQKLQADIDRVCGNRPPTLADMPELPYLRACVRESLRWRPAVPTGIPHAVDTDDIYNGHLIPAGSFIHAFEWGMSRNAALYPQPNAYNPDRWVKPTYPTYREPLEKYPTICHSSQFGFGRRICQGQDVAEADLFVGVGSIAWAFDIRKAINPETGLEIQVPEMDYTHLLIAKPKWFQFDIVPRDAERQARVEQMYVDEYAKGSFPDARNYWDPNNPALGWSKV